MGTAELSRIDPSTVEGSTEVFPNLDTGRLLHDFDGTARYLGESSGAAFLDSLKEFMGTLFPLAFADSWSGHQSPEANFVSSMGFYQTHDSRPLLATDTDEVSLPSMTASSIMLAKLRYFAQDGNGDFPSGGIYYWTNFDEVLRRVRPSPVNAPGTDSPGPLAMLYAALALSSLMNSSTDPASQSCNLWLAKAKNLLGNPLHSVNVRDAEVLGLIAMYLVETNRRDAAYMHVSVAVHILLMHGVHVGWLVDEAGKRLFWTIYVLER